MAVTITRAQLAARIRLGRTQTELDETDELLAYATEAVQHHAPDAPDVVQNEAVYRLAGYVYDRPFASGDTRFSNALRNSGAASALLPYREHRLGLTGADAAGTSTATAAGNAVTGIAIVGGNILVTYGNGSTENVPLPPAIGGVTITMIDRSGDDLEVTYSDGTVVTVPLPPGGGNLNRPGL